MVPAGLGSVTVRTILRSRKFQMRMLPRRSRPPGTACSVVDGQMKSLVTMRLISGRTEIPWGLKPSVGGSAGCSATSRRSRSNSATRPG